MASCRSPKRQLYRAAENTDIFDFDINEEDMKLIESFEGRAGRMENPDEKFY